MKANIFALGCFAVIGAMMWYAVSTALSLPNVYFDYHTNECVKVDNFGDTSYSCEELPKRFYHVWVINEETNGLRHQAGE